MKYKIFSDHIKIENEHDFNITHILDCGQVFRYEKTDFGYNVYAGEHKLQVYCQKGYTKIFCKCTKFAVNYFDLDTNYANIKLLLGKYPVLNYAINYGGGIRLLKQDALETIISFIISANNNIPKIKRTLNLICKNFGTDMGDYFAFPTLQQLSNISKNDFKSVGAGYRDEYLFSTVQKIVNGFDLNSPFKMSASEARAYLMTLKGVGRKVADCILLFAYGKTDVFPTDTWITKVYSDIYFENNLPAHKISEEFLKMFGKLSGYAQQYLFYERMNRK